MTVKVEPITAMLLKREMLGIVQFCPGGNFQPSPAVTVFPREKGVYSSIGPNSCMARSLASSMAVARSGKKISWLG